MIKSVSSLLEFQNFVQNQVQPLIQAGTLILLEGELGAGKTELVKNLCHLLGLQDIQSPTFAFHHLYAKQGLQLHHVDLYRARSEEDLESTGFWDLFENTEDVILVEWSNMIQDDAWPWGWKRIKIKIEKGQNENRRIEIQNFP